MNWFRLFHPFKWARLRHLEELAHKKATRQRRPRWPHARAIGKRRRSHKIGDYKVPYWKRRGIDIPAISDSI